MATVIIKSKEDIKQLTLADNYIIDVYPAFDEEDQFITDDMGAEADELQELVYEWIERLSHPEDPAEEVSVPPKQMSIGEVKKKYSTKELKSLAGDYDIPGRSKMREHALAVALLAAGAFSVS